MTELPRTDDDTSILDAFQSPAVTVPGGLGADESAKEYPEDERDDDLAAALAGAAPRRWWNRGTLVLGGCGLLLAGFLSGVLVNQHFGTTSGANGTAAARGTGNFAGFAGGGGFSGAGRGNGTSGAGTAGPGSGGTGTAAAAATTGTVKLVDGTTIYVQTASGDVITVKTNAKTAVSTATKTKVGDLKAGESVTVEGPAATDGTVTATSVTASGK